MRQVILIDLAGVVHALYHVNASNPDPDATSVQALAKVRALASGHPHVGICAEGGRSFRKDLDPEYKAQRPTEGLAPLYHQMALTIDALKADGFPVWSVPGFEGDDLLATGTSLALAYRSNPGKPNEDVAFDSVQIVSSDKDTISLVGPRVTVYSTASGKTYDEAAVVEKFGVNPSQIVDWLSLVGDSADNIKGARGVGPKRATELLVKYGNLEDLYRALTEHGTDFTAALATALREFEPRMALVRELITLRTDVPLPAFADIFKERMPEDAVFGVEEETLTTDALPAIITHARAPLQFRAPATETTQPAAPLPAPAAIAPAAAPLPLPAQPTPPKAAEPAALALIDQPAQAPLEYERQLEPRSLQQAAWIAEQLFRSRLFSAYGTAAGVLSTILAGREFGLSAMASLRGFHILESKPTMSADLIRALVIKSGKATYFRPTERTATRATWETKRGDDPAVVLSYTIEEAQQAGLVKPKSAWEKDPASMLTARASAKLARLIYSDVTFGLYDPSEVE